MAKAKQQQKFTVIGKITLELALKVDAESLETALHDSRNLSLRDFVAPYGDVWDADLKITGVLGDN